MSSAPVAGAAFERYQQRGGGGAAAANGNTVFKSGPLFISSKGIGWKSWKKRWFILTRTSLVFFKSDPSTLPQRGGEVNVTLGGIDLNNSGSVVVREDKKLLTVLFPDGRDGRAFTLKAETSEDLFEWKTALEEALAQAPNAALVMGHNGIFRNDTADTYEGAIPNWREKRPIKSLVTGRPILLALEDIDGSPSFLEKALRFLEKHGIKVEGILRQAADVEEVDRRLQEYDQGRTEFSADEDAHIVGDCVKHVLRELPSSPVPASCCSALLKAFRLETKDARINAMRSAISETFPVPNRRLLQRILKMMHTIASHTSENQMTASAVAACMVPLLLRPLLAGECEMDEVFDMDGDDSAQLLATANAANSAQGIIATLLEEYEGIFHDEHLRCSLSPESQIEDSDTEESTDDGNLDANGNGFHDAENDVDQEMDDDNGVERVLSGKLSESSGYASSDLYDYKAVNAEESDAERPLDVLEGNLDLSKVQNSRSTENGSVNADTLLSENNPSHPTVGHETVSMGEILSSFDPGISVPTQSSEYSVERQSNKINGSHPHVKRSNFWGRNNARKSQNSESVDSFGEEEMENIHMEFDSMESVLGGSENPRHLKLSFLKFITKKFSDELKIGRGGCGVVYKGIVRNQIIAVKRLLNSHTIEDKMFHREVKSMMMVNHKNVVRFLGYCSHTEEQALKIDGKFIMAQDRERLLCFEYLINGSLESYITDELRGLEWQTRYQIVKGICDGLHHLHSENHIVHMDLKPANILLDSNMVPKIIDFGLSRLDNISQTMSSERLVSLGYCAPEYLHHGKMSAKSDIYSLGVIIQVLVTGSKEEPNITKVHRRWKHRWNKSAMDAQLGYNQVAMCLDLVRRCIHRDPKQRPDIRDIINDLNKMDCSDVKISDGTEGLELEDMLGVEPLEIHLPFELNKQISCSVELTNDTDDHFAFRISTTSLRPYCIEANEGTVPPRSKCSVNISLQALHKALPGPECMDEFSVQSTRVDGCLAATNLGADIFNEELGKVIDTVNFSVVLIEALSTMGKPQMPAYDNNVFDKDF